MVKISSYFKRFTLAMLSMIVLASISFVAKSQTLGTYPNTSVVSGKNTVIIPSAAPTSTSSAVAYTNSNFTGLFTVNPTTGAVTVTDAKQTGTFTVTVRAFGTGTATTTFTLTVTNPTCSQGLFATTTNISVGTGIYPVSVAIGDFNGDGKQDFATANTTANNVSIRLGDGLGGFIATTNITTELDPLFVAFGDFNGDGKQDLAAANNGSNSISIRLGDGLGGFSGTTNIGVGTNPRSVAIGDFNGDGKKDLAATNNIASGTVSIRLGNGLGGFSGTTNIGVETNPFFVAVGDFNGDGKQDFAAANWTAHTVSIRIGDGLGGFSGATNISVGNGPRSVAIGDFNGDGKQDFASSNFLSNTVSICLGNGSGGFSAATNISIGSGTQPISVEIGDFNGDGKQDFATANYGTKNVSIRLGDGLGGFSVATNIPVGTNPVSVAIGDFDGDGKQDFAAANISTNDVSIGLGGVNEINVLGNAVGIADGNVTPSTSDHTDFGSVNVGSNLVRTYTIQNTGTANLTISTITKSGIDANEFAVSGITLPATILPNGSTTFTVTFTPTATDIRTATILVNNNDCDETPYDFAVQGTGCAVPTFTLCPVNQTHPTATGTCAATVSYTATATGTPTPTLTYAFTGATTATGSGTGSGGIFNKGATTVVITANNGCSSNATCSFTVTIADNETPTITCPTNILVNTDAGQCGAIVTYTVPSGSDNCPNAVTTQTAGLASGLLFPLGTTTNVYSVTDASGNTVTCSFTVTVVDNAPPTITYPPNILVNTDAGQCGAIVTYTVPSGSDNCPNAVTTQTAGLASGLLFPLGTTTNVYSVSDVSGNTATSSFTVTVVDNNIATATAGGSQTICAAGKATVSGAAATNGTITWATNGVGSITVGATTIAPTYTAAAADAGNTITLTMTVTGICSIATATYTVLVNNSPSIQNMVTNMVYCSLQEAINVAANGQLLHVGAGTITEDVSIPNGKSIELSSVSGFTLNGDMLIQAGATFKNKTTVTFGTDKKLTNNGLYTGNGSIVGAMVNNGTISPSL
jgi:FG-GAP-like repeat/HYR domain/Abnormal spindle-like microcephaly-assoc'd, ASPM-SPD-2-Hydin/FG-GAP repeat